MIAMKQCAHLYEFILLCEQAVSKSRKLFNEQCLESIGLASLPMFLDDVGERSETVDYHNIFQWQGYRQARSALAT